MHKLVVVAMIAAAIGLTACGKKDESKEANGSGSVNISGSGDHFSMTGANGEKVEIGTGASAKLPSYLPMYPGGTVTSSFTGSGQDGSGGVVVFHVHATPGDVIAFYKQKAAAAGMADTMNAEMGATTTYVAANEKAKQTITVSATKASDGSDVQLTWGSK
jgi:hypothetical protein